MSKDDGKRNWVMAMAAVAAVALVVVVSVAAIGVLGGGGSGSGMQMDAVSGVGSTAREAAPDAASDLMAPAPEGSPVDDGAVDMGGAPGDMVGEDRMVVRNGQVTVEHPREVTFEQVRVELAELARERGGQLTDVDARQNEHGEMVGTVTVQVPSDEFDGLMDEVSGLGEVVSQRVDSRDVTDEYVDLESRLTHLERQEQFYLELFDEADGVDDAIAVNRRLEEVQANKEMLQGRLRVLDQQVDLSTLTVQVVPEGRQVGTGEGPTRLGDYWEQSRDAFVTTVGSALVIVVGSLPLLLAAVVVAVTVSRWRRRRRQERAEQAQQEGASDDAARSDISA